MKFIVSILFILILGCQTVSIARKKIKNYEIDVDKQLDFLDTIDDDVFQDNLLIDKNMSKLKKYIKDGLLNFGDYFQILK